MENIYKILAITISVVIISTAFLIIPVYFEKPTSIEGFSALNKIGSIQEVQKIPGYEYVNLPSHVPEGFEKEPQIYQGKGDEHHIISLYYGIVTGQPYEEIVSSGFVISFSDYVDLNWEQIAQQQDSFNTVDNKTVIYYQYDYLSKTSVVYGGEPQSISVYSQSLSLQELEKILRSTFKGDA